MARALANAPAPWKIKYEATVVRLGRTDLHFNGDEVEAILGSAPNPYAVGGLWNRFVKRGIVVPVGERPMQSSKAHGRRTRLYRGPRP